MKKSIQLFIAVSLLYACNNTPEALVQDDTIAKVESNLIQSVFVEGDTLWTIEERMSHYGVPGVSIAVIKDSKIAWVKSYGVLNKESNEPVTDQSLFQAGSISKPVAAFGALKLVEQNKLDLDQDINTYLTSWKIPDSEFTNNNKVALKHLLSHTGGLTVHGFLGYSPDLPVPTLVQVLNGEKPANSPAIFVDKAPEESFRYSGGGYTIMQQAVIDVEGQSYPEAMNTLVLQPLEMNNSTYDQPLKAADLEMAATGYLPDGSMTKGERHTYPEMAAAGLWTTSADLAKFAIDIQKSLKGESNKVLSKTMTEKMLTPFVEDFIGLGIFLPKFEEEPYFGHGGWDEGFSSEMIAHKTKGYGVVVLTNSNHPDFISELIRSVALTYNWDGFVPKYKAKNITEDDLKNVVGRYRLNNGEAITISHSGNKLFAKELIGEQQELFKITDSTFLRRQGHKYVQFKTNTDGEVNMLIIDPSGERDEQSLKQMSNEEKLPLEYLLSDNFEKALEAYQSLMETNPEDEAVNENNLNRMGYNLLNEDNIAMAKKVFKVNVMLYPESFNVYDSYAEACMKHGDLDSAITNYKKSLELNPSNANAEAMLLEISKMKE